MHTHGSRARPHARTITHARAHTHTHDPSHAVASRYCTKGAQRLRHSGAALDTLDHGAGLDTPD